MGDVRDEQLAGPWSWEDKARRWYEQRNSLAAQLQAAQEERDYYQTIADGRAAEIERLRGALRAIADEEPTVADSEGLLLCLVRQSDLARQALTPEGTQDE